MKFYRIAHHTIMSGLVIRYCEITKRGNSLEISASRDGVLMQGATGYLREDDVQDITEIIYQAHSLIDLISSKRLDVSTISISQEPACVVETRKAHFAGDDEILETREREEV